MNIPNWFYDSMRECSFRTAEWFDIRSIKVGEDTFDTSSRENYVLILCTKGQMKVHYVDQVLHLAVGDIMLVPPGHGHKERAFKARCEFIRAPLLLMGFKLQVSNPLGKLPLPVGVRHPDIERMHDQIQQAREFMIHKGQSDKYISQLKLNVWTNALLLNFIEAGFNQESFNVENHEVDAWVLAAKLYIEDHFKDPDFTIAKLSRHMGYSSRHIQTKFKESFGRTPKEYLHSYRMTVAMRMLGTNPDIKIEYLMKRCGYRTRSLFNQLFIRYHGKPPSAFR